MLLFSVVSAYLLNSLCLWPLQEARYTGEWTAAKVLVAHMHSHAVMQGLSQKSGHGKEGRGG